MRNFSVGLPVHVADWVEHTAHSRGKATEQFLMELITETVEERAEPVEVRLQRIDELIGRMAVLAKKMPMQEEKEAKTGTPPLEERKKKREHLIEIGMEAYDELRKIAASEQSSKEAESPSALLNT